MKEIGILVKKRHIISLACATVLSTTVLAQTTKPTAPAPSAPAPQQSVHSESPFPATNPRNFTADSPTVIEVNSFLRAIWGYDTNRIWQVAAIVKTPAPGVAKVVVLVADKRAPSKTAPVVFFTTPDGKHAIAENVMDFGAHPFADARKTLEDHADGPAIGAKSKDLLLVEFADLQCERCKTAQDKIDQLQQDFPEARIVFEDVPQPDRAYDERAALDGVCVRKAKGDAAFFSYARAVYAKQAGLTAQSADETLNAAVKAAGADPAAIRSCAALPDTKAALDAASKLDQDLGAGGGPVLAVNGHFLPIESIPYDTLKQMIAYQAGQDGLAVHLQPTLTTLQ